MLPSCGWSQSSLIVGIGPRFSRSMFRASSSSCSNAVVLRQRRRDQRRPDLRDHLPLLALDHGDEREHVLLLRHRRGGRRTEDDRRSQVVAPLARHEAAVRVVCRRHLHHARLPSAASMSAEMAGACPGTVNAASEAFGSSGGSGPIGPSRSASASAMARPLRGVQIPEQLMQPLPLLISTLSTIRSRCCSQLSASSSPSRILLKPGPCTCTRRVGGVLLDRRGPAEDHAAPGCC